MTIPSRALAPAAAILLAALAAGCGGVLKPKPDPTRFFVLGPATAAPAFAAPAWSGSVGLLPVRLPAYLADRREFVTRDGAELAYEPTFRWAEPRARSVGERLRRALAERLPAARVEEAPWSEKFRPGVLVEVEVVSLEPGPDGTVALVGRWALLDAGTRSVVRAADVALREPATPGDPQAAVAATGAVLDQLADRVAAAVAGGS